MQLFMAALGIILLGGVGALLTYRRARLCTAFGVGGAVIGGIAGLISAVSVLLGEESLSLYMSWAVPFGSLNLVIDKISAFFLVLIFGIGGLAAVYGGEYLSAYREKKWLGGAWFFYALLMAGMAVVVTARNGVLFLVAWEVMSLASFFLVTFEDEESSVREAGWTYLVATHIGTAFLTAFFILLGRETGSMDFHTLPVVGPATANVLFALALVGFGTKAGLMPMHIWLPEAHPAAPSHVSAVMSGVMIKTGIYGIVRTLTMLGEGPMWWGWLLIGVGVISGVMGILFGLSQRNLKRLLAYSSVENIGIITIGLGMGVLGMSVESPGLMVAGFGGAFFHILNHALFKGLLFMGAGAVLHTSGTAMMDRLGGLGKTMPWTSGLFLIGAVSISALPPFNGFVGEFLLYLGAFSHNDVSSGVETAIFVTVVIGGLALIGGLAAVCFTKAFGIVFLGEPRSEAARHGHEAGWAMKIAMAIPAAGCLMVGIFSPKIFETIGTVIGEIVKLPAGEIQTQVAATSGVLWQVVEVGGIFVGAILILGVVRWRLLRGREVTSGPTWDCGYASGSPRIQYTGSSFTEPVVTLFEMFIRSKKTVHSPGGLFPQSASMKSQTPDIFTEHAYRPGFVWVGKKLSKLWWLQQGRVQLYVLYIALTLWILLMWKLR